MDPNTALLFAKINLVSTIILIIITGCYAYSTAKILNEMHRQADTAKEQSTILGKYVQVSILSALINSAGEQPIPKLRALLKEFETFLAEKAKSTSNP